VNYKAGTRWWRGFCPHLQMSEYKIKIAWFSELNRPDSLSSYFSSSILPYLKEKFDISLYHNSFDEIPGFETSHYLKAFEDDRQKDFDIFFYQLEDHQGSNFVRSHLGLIPGITYFHHFNLSNYGPEPLLNSPYSDIAAKFNSGDKAWPERDKKYKPKGPAAYRESALSPVSIFSNPHSLDEYKRQISLKLKLPGEAGLNAFYLPYPVKIEKDLSKKRETQSFRIAYIGSTRIENRAHKVLAAMADLGKGIELDWLIPAHETSEAKDMLEEYQISGAKLHTEYDPQSWKEIVINADCAIHTLFSVYGHSEPYLSISLAHGLPVLVTNFASTESMPDNILFKIQPGETESIQITEIIKAILEDNTLEYRETAIRYCVENNDPAKIAAELASIFRKRKDYLRDFKNTWQKLCNVARESLLNESSTFLDSENEIALNMVLPVFKELGWQA
jgi:hypothetical protein